MRRKLILVFLLLLAASHAMRFFRADERVRRADGQIATLSAIGRNGLPTGGVIELGYRDLPADDPANAPVLVLLHGSPGTSNQVNGLAGQLRGHARLIIPDLPGFGASSTRLPDYSIRSHARYLLELLDKLGIEKAHLLGFSLGGGVALELTALAPGRIASVILVSSIGVQELELLGDYTLNHSVHGAQLGALWLLQEAVPHFGLLDNSFFNVSYARNFFDTDQRPLRGILNEFEAPMLIIHGRKDFLVPVSAAIEHHRIVPQSELLVFDDGHFRIFRDPASLSAPALDFVRQVESGEAATRAAASPERIRAASEPFNWNTHGRPRPIGAGTMSVLLALSTFGSEDLTCIGAGILASRGALPYVAAVAACFVGIFIGDFLLYFAGRALGTGALARAPFRWFITETDIERSKHFFHRYGPSLILTTRFIPGARLPTYVTAGLLGTGFWRFAAWFLLAAALWTPLLVGLAYLVGGRMLTWFEQYEHYTLVGLILVILLLLLLPKLILPLLNPSGRRLLLSRWRRLTRWEFWPPWVFYPPIVLYCLWLGLRRGKATLFTAANPSIPAGGLALESKTEILDGFQGGAGEIAVYQRIPRLFTPEEKIAAVDAFLAGNQLDYPVVLKPDVGERGRGVAVIRSREEARDYLRRCPQDVIAQEHVEGDEFGIFYYRYPAEENGRIFSITDKRLIGVTGDGRRTLEELILADDRAVCSARFFLAQFARRLDEIPGDGERVPLTELGTHCRGALFLDGSELRTPALEKTIDALSKQLPGFYFGRYDIRVRSREELREGRGFKVLELNGVTSEATHIYAPGTSLFSAYRVLMEQWRIAFDIGRENVKKGAIPYSIPEVIRLLQQFRNAEKFEV